MRATARFGLGAGLALALAWGPLSGQPPTGIGPRTPPPDSARMAPPNPPAPSQTLQDSSRTVPPRPGSDSVSRAPKSRSDSVIVVKHSFNHREQIITGSVIMTCLALIMVTMNNYNPR